MTIPARDQMRAAGREGRDRARSDATKQPAAAPSLRAVHAVLISWPPWLGTARARRAGLPRPEPGGGRASGAAGAALIYE